MSKQVLAANLPTLAEFLHKELRERILDGSLPGGSQLVQVDLAEQYGVSRTPIRETLARLDREGLVELRPRRGYIVATIEIAQIEEVCELRRFIEERASHIATLRRTDEDIAALEKILLVLDENRPATVGEFSSWARANREFHVRLIVTSKREFFVRTAETLYNTVERFIRLEGAVLERLDAEVDQAQAEHIKIFAAFSKGDADQVSTLIRAHCDHTRDRLIKSLRQRGGSNSPWAE